MVIMVLFCILFCSCFVCIYVFYPIEYKKPCCTEFFKDKHQQESASCGLFWSFGRNIKLGFFYIITNSRSKIFVIFQAFRNKSLAVKARYDLTKSKCSRTEPDNCDSLVVELSFCPFPCLLCHLPHGVIGSSEVQWLHCC